MNRLRGLAILCLTLACFMTVSSVAAEPRDAKTPSPSEAKQQVIDLGKKWAAAEIKRDVTSLRRILDDKFVASFDSQKPLDKEAFIKLIVSDDGDTMESQTLNDEIVIVDQDTAVVVGTDTVRGTEKGKPSTDVLRYTVTYIHRNGRWVALAEHLVSVPKAK